MGTKAQYGDRVVVEDLFGNQLGEGVYCGDRYFAGLSQAVPVICLDAGGFRYAFECRYRLVC